MSGELRHHPASRAVILTALSCCLLLGVVAHLRAQQLPIRHYRVSDGLAHDRVGHVYQDRYNYLWISTSEGLSRFDGYRFVTYDRRHGLGSQVINFVTEDRLGRLWVATNGAGVARLLDEDRGNVSTSSQKKFVTYPVSQDPESNAVNAMVFDAANLLWCLTDAGLFRGREDSSGNLTFELVEVGTQPITKSPALFDSRGRLWFGIRKVNAPASIISVIDGKLLRYDLAPFPLDEVTAICEDAQGRVLATTLRGRLLEFTGQTDASGRGGWAQLPLKLAPQQALLSMYADRGGTLWLGTDVGLIKYREGQQSIYTRAHGLSSVNVMDLTSDREGNLWLATGNGLSKISGEQILRFTSAEGLPDQNFATVLEGRNGHIYGFTQGCCALELNENRVALGPDLTSTPMKALWAGQTLLDRWGDWWFVTPQGLYRFNGPDFQLRRGENMNRALGLSDKEELSRIFETSDRRVWLSTEAGPFYELELRPQPRVLKRWVMKEANSEFKGRLLAMVTDSRGALWLGTQMELGRFAKGRLDIIPPTPEVPEISVRSLFYDSRGWLWVGLRNYGALVIKDPGAELPQFINLSTRQGLTSNTVWSITEDNFGRIYLGTGKGLAQIEPLTNRIRMLNSTDGLAGDQIGICFKDSRGDIWITSAASLSRLKPQPPAPPVEPPPVYLSRVMVAGEELALPERGLQRVSPFELTASRNNLLIEYVAVSFRAGARMRYQYKLEGVDPAWSAATDQRSVNYASLAPGGYRFLVRAINEDGLTTSLPAQIEFRVLPPIYLRWWFMALAATALGLAAYALYRYRVARLVELERVRTRIATDLHDDVGASLSLVAMLSEVARQQAARGDTKALESLASIAAVARELVDSTSDIVWAVNPRKDRVSELITRMRRFASDALGSRDVLLRFAAPNHDHDFPLGADARREIYFIFKETVNNIARHAGCSEADINLSVENGWLVLRMRDNGKGFDPAQRFEGNGLESMRGRARKLGGELRVVSEPGSGSEITLRVPLTHRGSRA